MCKYCDLGALEPANFDSFFVGASTHGFKSMVCKNCSTTFITQLLTLESESQEKVHYAVRETEEKNLVLLPH